VTAFATFPALKESNTSPDIMSRSGLQLLFAATRDLELIEWKWGAIEKRLKRTD
jgi:hypothetical protein